MKLSFLKKILCLVFVSAFFLAFTTKNYKSNFSGQWKLNESKSELGQFSQFAVRTIKADQKDESITVTRTSPSFNGGDMTNTETLSYDGKETVTTVFENSKRKSTAKWSDDGQSLLVNYILLLEFNGESMEIKGTETWTLSADGKNLTVQINSASPQGEFSAKAVYDKQ
jgi:hypothetical protein